ESGGIAQSDDIAPKAAESPPTLEGACPSLGGGIVRIRRFSGIVILATGLGLVAGAPGARAAGPDTAPPLVTNLKPVTDAVGDAVNTATSAVVDNGRADITAASLEYAPGWIRMKVQLKTPTDPLKDAAWSDKSD